MSSNRVCASGWRDGSSSIAPSRGTMAFFISSRRTTARRRTSCRRPGRVGRRGGARARRPHRVNVHAASRPALRVPGADPGAVRLHDGSWLLLVTGPPRPGTPSALRRGPGQGPPPPEPAGDRKGPARPRLILRTVGPLVPACDLKPISPSGYDEGALGFLGDRLRSGRKAKINSRQAPTRWILAVKEGINPRAPAPENVFHPARAVASQGSTWRRFFFARAR